ncbi:MAG: META domain-containing protein [Rhodobacteraceae bacterium]|nr:META domain-containing protein [Paracoccaceae bacterium]
MRSALILALAGLAACSPDETVSAYGGADKIWVLSELDGNAFSARATLTFPEPGRIAGQSPCNTYSGQMEAPYPWFETGPLAVTRRACPDMAQEQVFLAALDAMTQSEVSGDVLVLSTEDGREMVFKSDG